MIASNIDVSSVFSSEEMAFAQGQDLEDRSKIAPIVGLHPDDILTVSISADGGQLELIVSNETTRYGSPAATSKWIGNLPESRNVGWHRWYCAPTDFNVLAVKAMWGNRVRFGDEAAALLFSGFLERFQEHYAHARMRAAFKLNGEPPELPEWYVEHPDFPLSPYQRVSAVSAIDMEMSALLLDPSLGKTCIGVNVFMNEAARARERDPKSLYTVLIVAPRAVRFNWKSEITRFATVPGQVTVLRGTALDRVKLLTEAMIPASPEVAWSAVVCSYDTIVRTWAAFRLMTWDRCILDESQLIKGHYTRRWKIFKMLRERCTRRMLATGTFIGNTVMDAYSQLEFLGDGFSGFSDWKAFRKFYCSIERAQIKDASGKKQKRDLVTGFKNMPMLQERLNRVASIFSKKEVLRDLPEKVHDCLEVTMTPRQAEIYEATQAQIALEIEAAEAAAERGDGRRMTADNVLVRLLRLAQITSGYCSWDQELAEDGESLMPKVIEPIEPNPKIAALKALVLEHLAEEPDNKLMVWSCFTQDVNRVCALLAEMNIGHVRFTGTTDDEERLEAERLFNDKDSGIRVFVGNPAAGGVGLNLRGFQPTDGGTGYASRAVYFAQGWSSIIRRQSEDRCHGRDRCRGQVRYTTLVVPGSVDEEIYDRVMSRTQAANQLNDVRDLMNKVLSWTPDSEEISYDDESDDSE